MTKNKQFYQSFFSVCIVLMLQNIITISVNLADNIMLGGYSETSLAGAAAVNQIQFVFQQLLFAVGEGIVILGSQYWGKRQTRQVKNISATALKTGLFIGIILFSLVSLFPQQALHMFTTNDSIAAEGLKYLNIIRFSYLFFAVTVVMQGALRCAEIVRISLYLSIMTFFVNCGINFVLIYGRFGAPRLGVQGAAIGTLVARILECIVILTYASRKNHAIVYRLRELFAENKLLRIDYMKTAAPIMVVQGLWGFNNAIQTMILGHMTDSAIAASSISSTLYLLLKSMAVGASSAASIMIGKSIGEGDMKVVKEYARTLQFLFVGIGLISGTILFFLRIPVLSLYDLSAETKAMANSFLILQSLVCVSMSYQMPTNSGIIRGGGSTQFVVKLDLISIWCIVLPVSYLMAFVVKASPLVVFCCLNADQFFKCVPAWIKVNRGVWIRKLTRENI